MKTNRLIALFVLLCAFVFTSCDPDNFQHPDVLKGNWASVVNAKDPSLFLYIDDDVISVRNGSWNYRPFTNDVEWEYYMSKDSVLHIYRTDDYGDDYDTESYDLDLSFSDSYNTLTLYYDQFLGSPRKYTFIRRY